MLNGVLVLRYQVGIDCLTNSCDSNCAHIFDGTETGILKITGAKVQKIFDVCNGLSLFFVNESEIYIKRHKP